MTLLRLSRVGGFTPVASRSNGGTVITTFTSVLIGASSISQLGVLFGAFAAARVAAFDLYAIIDRVPSIDPRSEAGQKPPRERVQGRVEFRNVTFAYPSREGSSRSTAST